MSSISERRCLAFTSVSPVPIGWVSRSGSLIHYVAEANHSQRNSAELPHFITYLSAYLLCVWCVHVCAVTYACLCTFMERLQVNLTCHFWKPFLFLRQSSSQKPTAHGLIILD